jgi:hypothetical protein
MPSNATNASVMPATWYFPTPDPKIVLACDYNPLEKRYNRNCREIQKSSLATSVKAGFTRIANGTEKV